MKATISFIVKFRNLLKFFTFDINIINTLDLTGYFFYIMPSAWSLNFLKLH